MANLYWDLNKQTHIAVSDQIAQSLKHSVKSTFWLIPYNKKINTVNENQIKYTEVHTKYFT